MRNVVAGMRADNWRTWRNTWTLAEIRERLEDDGYLTPGAASVLPGAVRRAFREGRLLWTKERLTIVGRDCVTLFPEVSK